MTKGLARSLLLAVCWWPAGAPVGLAEGIKTETGRLPELIARLASREYVLGSPSSDSRTYVDPAPALHAFRHLASAMAWGDVAAAARQAAQLDYEVVQFTDSDTQRDYFVLREDLQAVDAIRGWGSYIVNPNSRTDAIVEVPHPMADVHTPEIGGKIFEQCQAKGFLLAGTHRDKADVPDLVDSIFHQVHIAWIGPAAQVAAWQIHGFAAIKHSFPKQAQVVTSTGDGSVAPEVANLDATLKERGLVSFVFNELSPDAELNKQLNGDVPGATFASLAGAKNEQGRVSRSLGGSFVHVELEGSIRADAASRDRAGSAIATVIGGAGQTARATEKAPAQSAASDGAAGGEQQAAPIAASDAAESGSGVRIAAKPVAASPDARTALSNAANELPR